MRKFLYIIIGFFAVLLMSCEQSSTTTTLSSVAQLSAFAFASNDSMPGLAAAVFTVEERIDTGLVWNKDSILYGTRLDSVVPRFSFAATPGTALLKLSNPDTTIVLSGADTLDFTRNPIYLTVKSQDGKNTKVYLICATVHQSDPDLFNWECLNTGIYPPDESEQRVLELNGNFVMIANNGFKNEIYTSPDGITWANPGTPVGLPVGTNVRQIISDGSALYYGQGNAVYRSVDAIHWTNYNVDYPIVTMLLYWNKHVWALIDNIGYQLAYLNNNQLDTLPLRPAWEFPVSDFATVTFQSASGRERAMILGGFAENGMALSTRWNLEYSTHPIPTGSYRMEDFSMNRTDFNTVTGASVVWYNNALNLFGGVDMTMNYLGRDILLSEDEGMLWYKADTAKNQLPEVYQARQKQSAIVRDNYIYLFGGQDAHMTYSDVYRGRLNSIDW